VRCGMDQGEISVESQIARNLGGGFRLSHHSVSHQRGTSTILLNGADIRRRLICSSPLGHLQFRTCRRKLQSGATDKQILLCNFYDCEWL
jgi:hypothetical protein